jgi:hypothetical protein
MKRESRHLFSLIFSLPISIGLFVFPISVSAAAASSSNELTTCTNLKTGANRILLKGSCTSNTEKKVVWKKSPTKPLTGAITTCENLKTGKSRLLIKGVCVAKNERTNWWTSSTAQPTPLKLTYKIGEIGPGGGLIFYVDAKNEYPTFDYLEAAPIDLKDPTIWCSDISHSITTDSGHAEEAIGWGQANTISMLAVCNSGAANEARAYSSNGKSDWFLPSRGELVLMYQNIHSLSTFAATDYWSSTENSAIFAETVTFGNGNWASLDKSFARRVRPVRSFLENSAPHPTATASTPAASLYKVGETGPGGGWIFFVDAKNEFPTFDYLEAAPADIVGTYLWCSDTTHTIPSLAGAPAKAIGRGAGNTKDMLAICTFGAANAAATYIKNGKSDWFLPSIDELKLMYDNLRKLGTFSTHGFEVGEHWSSSEAYESGAMVQNFDDRYLSSTGGSLKSARLFVRPIRSF